MVNRSWNRSYEYILYIYSENNTTCIRNIKTLLQIRFTNIENTPTHRNGSINVKAVLLAVLLFLKYKSFNNFSNITWPVTVGSSKKSSWTLFLWIYFLFRLINLFVQYLLTVLFLILTFLTATWNLHSFVNCKTKWWKQFLKRFFWSFSLNPKAVYK